MSSIYFSYVLHIRAFKATDLTGDHQIINMSKTLEWICLIHLLSTVCHLQECVMRGKKKYFFLLPFFNVSSSLIPWLVTVTRENCLWYLARPLGFRLSPKSLHLALGCRMGLHGSLQELGHVRIICSMHFDSKSMYFGVSIERGFLFLFSGVCVFFSFCKAPY